MRPDKERGPGESPDPDKTAGLDTDSQESTPATTPGPVHRHNTLAGLAPIPCQCWICRWYRACDKAIDLNGAVRLEGAQSIMVVADTVVAELAANGGEIPETYRLVRDDGRTVYVFHDEAVTHG
jgi:hypothetical protein